MKLKIIVLLLSTFTLSIVSAQKNNNTKSKNTKAAAFYYKNGVKMNTKHHTPMVISNINDMVMGNSSEQKGRYWINENREKLKVSNMNDLKLQFSRKSLSGQTLRYQQTISGVPVYHSEIVVHLSPKNRVTYVTNTYDPSVQVINTTPKIEKTKAYNLAYNKIDAHGNIAYQDVKLIIYNKSDKTHLAYKVVIEPEFPTGSWEVLVDAHNGQILRTEDKAYYYKKEKKSFLPKPSPVNGTGNVFDPDPLSYAGVSYGGNYSDNSDATNAQLDAATISVTLLDIDNTAGTYTLKGPFAEIQDFESPSKGLFTQGSSNFNFNRSDDGFEAVNCYYIIDKSMRYINQTLGITLMPFQYSGGVRYDPHGLNGQDNSHYTGGSGRLAFGEGGVDDAEDADVITHELGHGLHDWLTGGNLSQVDGLSEGSGDYWGQSYSRSLGQWTPADPEYNWFFSWDGHNSFWSGRITNYTASYPGGLVGAIHTDGQIWASALMRIYDILGREKVDKAFLEGLAMTGSSTSQEDAAIAVRQAAIDMGYTCPDIDVFTQEFTTTGYNMPPLNLAQFPPVISDVTECQSGIPADVAGNGNSLNWYSDPGLTNLLQTGTTLNTGETTPGVYTYYVKYSDPACSVAPSDTVTLTINALPNVSLGPDIVMCETDTITLDAGSFNSYLWQDNSTAQTFFVDGNITGPGTFTYYVDVTDANNCTNTDSITVDVSICTGITDHEEDNISIYPIPTSDIINISMKSFEPNTKIQLIDNSGRIIISFNAKNNNEKIDLSGLANGIYSLMIKSEIFIVTKKIIKQ